ncbi:MAG: phosphotriesterase-related protein [Firmicutes bacterium HGW-Firmicutes-7]|nr:MAG: phosphotriesterase-related protein [Firmicutes bacterium HGW-Firmicutes-7]
MIQTVTGNIDKDQLGYTLAHEHLILDLSHIRNDTDSILDDIELIVSELEQAKATGLHSIVDVTNIGMGRDILKLAMISRITGLNVIASTGYYQEQYYTNDLKSKKTEEIAKIFINELTVGVEGTVHRAGVIAEIGSSNSQITKEECKVFHAAALASRETGASIITHCEQGTMALEQVELFRKAHLPMNSILIGHMDLVNDLNYIKRVLETGVSIAFDTIGKIRYVLDEHRIEKLMTLLELGYEDHIILSLDISRKSYLKGYGGHGYSYMFDSFMPRLKGYGVSDDVIYKLMNKNISGVLNLEK